MGYATNFTDKLKIIAAPALSAHGRHRMAEAGQGEEAAPPAIARRAFARLRRRFGAIRPTAWLFATQPEHALAYLTEDEL